ncbi:recombinase family protein [Mycolicibacterium fluoranthenivorans]|uniref:recombinase family protein n=1 Tax=Mycolicibacterium fluoranthenivorans TaxID=258505 RepID=UPI001F3DB518|nr:recombinase family protein [Mycolicibacterium fluoranthenivorans]
MRSRSTHTNSIQSKDLDAQLAGPGRRGRRIQPRVYRQLSGAVNVGRPGLAALLHYAREADTVVVTAIDRLGRSVAEVTRTIANLG